MLISRVEDLPDFDAMTEDDIVDWWETRDVTAKVMNSFSEGNIEEDMKMLGLDPQDYLKTKR